MGIAVIDRLIKKKQRQKTLKLTYANSQEMTQKRFSTTYIYQTH